MSGKKLSAKATEFDDNTLDRAQEAYQAEFDRWNWRRGGASRYEIIRDAPPLLDVIVLAKRDCLDKHDAEAWLNTYRGRAAMTKALEAL